MRPVAKIATGFVVVFGALRFNGFDVLFDPVGWAFCVAGLEQLRRSERDLPERAKLFAVVMAFVSFFALLAAPAIEGESPLRYVLGFANGGGGLVAVWLIADALTVRLRACGDVARIARLDVLRWGVVGLGAIAMVAEFGYAGLGLGAVLGWFAAIVALVVALYRWAPLPCLAPVAGPRDKPLI